jgi:tetratricopeptide (TPR) repeat protein
VAAALAPKDPISNLTIAIYEHQHGNPRDAIRFYQIALAGMDDPLEQAKLYQNMGVAYRDIGDHEQFEQCIQKSFALRRAAAAAHKH